MLFGEVSTFQPYYTPSEFKRVFFRAMILNCNVEKNYRFDINVLINIERCLMVHSGESSTVDRHQLDDIGGPSKT